MLIVFIHVQQSNYHLVKLYFTSMQIRGGYVVFWTLYLGFGILSRLLYTLQTWVLALWAEQYEFKHPEDVSVS